MDSEEEEKENMIGFGESVVDEEKVSCLKDELEVSNMNNVTIKTLYFNQYFMKHLKNSNSYSPFNEINLNMFVHERL